MSFLIEVLFILQPLVSKLKSMRKLVRIAFLKKFRSELLVQNDGYTVVGLDLENFRLGRVDETFVTTSSSMSSGKLVYWIKYRDRNTKNIYCVRIFLLSRRQSSGDGISFYISGALL